MKSKTLRSLFHDGQLKYVLVETDRKMHGWHVSVRDQKGELISLTTTGGTECCFHNLDRACRAAHDIGFDEMVIVE